MNPNELPTGSVLDIRTGTPYVTTSQSQERHENGYGRGGGGGTMEPVVPLKDYVDKGDEATLARAEKAVGELSAKIDALPARMLWTALGTVVATVSLLVAVLAFGFDRFDGGASAAGAFSGELVASKERDATQAQAIKEINEKLDRIASKAEKK